MRHCLKKSEYGKYSVKTLRAQSKNIERKTSHMVHRIKYFLPVVLKYKSTAIGEDPLNVRYVNDRFLRYDSAKIVEAVGVSVVALTPNLVVGSSKLRLCRSLVSLGKALYLHLPLSTQEYKWVPGGML